MTEGRQSFSVDIAGLLQALTEQFPEPLLCVRELVQNAADAGAQRIEVDVAYDAARSLFRLSVRDDGRGMNAREVEGYLTIGFSEKDPSRDRGRFGVGKLSPYALGIVRMVVETCDGQATHRLVFNRDGSGTISKSDARPRGTVVRVYKQCGREEAEQLAERTFKLVEERCGSISIPLYVNGHSVNRDISLPTIYALPFQFSLGKGVLGITADPVHMLMGGGIVLETDAPILGAEVSYILDSPRLAPTLSRNAVRRDHAFDTVLKAARAQLGPFTAHVARQLRVRTDRLRQEGVPVERGLDANDRAALEWLRSRLLEPEDDTPDPIVRSAPVLETADGALVSAQELIDTIRREGRVPTSRVPRTRDEISAYADRGVPVLLLYRDLEDFLERQAIETVEVDGEDDGVEIAEGDWSPGELALAERLPVTARPVWQRPAPIVAAASIAVALAIAGGMYLELGPRSAEPAVAVAPANVGPVGAPTGTATSNASLLPMPAKRPVEKKDRLLVTLAGIVAVISAVAGTAMIYLTFTAKTAATASWLRAEAGAPMTVGETRRRRFNVLSRAVLHPIDFFVARGWSARASGPKPLGGASAIKGYRELAPEAPIRSGVRLDLDQVRLGFVDLVSSSGDPHDGRILIRRGERILLNRNHPTVRDLIVIAESDKPRARLLLDVLLATDPELARGTDPRQVEWDLLGRAEHGLRHGHTHGAGKAA
ncbi:ATP-binding protein [Myxococcota bacterium]|nr:ATP-binding protein [Myxococcota bacterium]